MMWPKLLKVNAHFDLNESKWYKSSGENTTRWGNAALAETVYHVVGESSNELLQCEILTTQQFVSGFSIVYPLEDLPGFTSPGRSYAPSERK